MLDVPGCDNNRIKELVLNSGFSRMSWYEILENGKEYTERWGLGYDPAVSEIYGLPEVDGGTVVLENILYIVRMEASINKN